VISLASEFHCMQQPLNLLQTRETELFEMFGDDIIFAMFVEPGIECGEYSSA